MYISPINSKQNINSKAKFSLLAEKNLLPKGAIKQFTEKANSIGNSSNVISISLYKMRGYDNKGATRITTFCYTEGLIDFSNADGTIVKGSHKERQNFSFQFINNYLEELKKKFENK